MLRLPGVFAGALLALAAESGEAAEAGATCARAPGREVILEGIERNFEGDYEAADAVWRRLRDSDPGSPAGPHFQAETHIWRNSLDEPDTRFDAEIESEIRNAERLAERRLERDAGDAIAELYWGQSLTLRARLRGMRGQLLSAGRDAERARGHLERALELCPELVDARFALGLYFYYASLLPDLFQWLSFLPFVPTGDAATGLEYLIEVSEQGDLNRTYARYIVSNIFSFHESGRRREALEMLSELSERYPDNTILQFERMDLLYEMGRYRQVIAEADLIQGRPAPHPHFEPLHSTATIWRAQARLHLGEPRRALELLEPLGAEGPKKPAWARPWFAVTRAQSFDALGERERAVRLYEYVSRLKPPPSGRALRIARRGLQEPFGTPAIRSD